MAAIVCSELPMNRSIEPSRPTDALNTSTRVNVRLCYLPPGGAFGHAIAALFGADPKTEMDADLLRMKSTIETGRPPRDAAQRLPAPRES